MGRLYRIKTPPTLVARASIIHWKSLFQSGKAKQVAEHKAPFKFSNAVFNKGDYRRLNQISNFVISKRLKH
jgi:hypothetical protein